MDNSPAVPSQDDVDNTQGFSLADADILVAHAEKVSSDDVRRNLQNQQNYQNN